MAKTPPNADFMRVREEILDFKQYVAGRSIDEIKARHGLSRVVKMASNENPLGTSPMARRAMERHAGMAFRYPQSGNPRLTEALGAALGVAPARIVPGNGSDEIIDLLIRVKARPGVDNVVAFRPCFSMYQLQARLCGVAFRQVGLNPDFTFPWDALLDAVDEHTALVFVTSPDNPSGMATPVGELAALARALPPQALLVVDEAYIDFAVPQEDYSPLSLLDELPNVVLLRTFSKMYGLAGLRLGYGVLPEWLADYLWRVRLPFSVNILAEEAGLAALADTAFYQATMETVVSGREYLTKELTALGCDVVPSQANFVLFRPADEVLERFGGEAVGIFEAMLAQGIILRPTAGSYGMPDRLRVSVGTEAENKECIGLLAEVFAGKVEG